ncbi:MAG TPA: GntR family transcriptional regulator [Streptosporangiaceae bacterium]|nr:GntR family transcriptional regulator [Streptosporangiaceae bacterium]
MPLESPRAQFRQLADEIRAAVGRGEYPPGSTLPSEPELARRYGVSRLTVNRAVGLLRTEGLVRVERGKGTVVREIPMITRDAMSRYLRTSRERGEARGAFDSEVRGLGLTPRTEVTVERLSAPAAIAVALELAEGADVVTRNRRMYANDVPVQLATSWIPAEIADGTRIAEPDSGPGGIISRFAELGYAQTRITERIQVRRPSDGEARFLRLDNDQAVTEIWHTGWTAEDRPVEVCVHVVPAHLWALDYEWSIEPRA